MSQTNLEQLSISSPFFLNSFIFTQQNQLQKNRKRIESCSLTLNADRNDAEMLKLLMSRNNFQKRSFVNHLTLRIERLEDFEVFYLNQLLFTSFKYFQLYELDITLSRCGELDENIVIFLKNFIGPHSQLVTLKIKIDQFLEVTDTYLVKLAKISVRFPLLKKFFFSIHYSDCSDDGITRFAHRLTSLRKLKILSLKLSGCNQISSQGFEDLVLEFRKLPQLETLTLRFVYCPQMSNETLANIGSRLSCFKNLILFQLFISNSKNIDDTGLISFADILAKVPNLQRVSLFFRL